MAGSRRRRPREERAGGFDRKTMEAGIRLFLQGARGTAGHPDLARTPRLVAEAWSRELLSGYLREEPYLIPLEEKPPDALVVVRGIRFVSVCRHHLLPFQGRAAVGYLPGKRLAGFSGIARLVETLSRRLMIQEELSQQILDHLESALSPRGAACLIEATHQCMTCRGARQAEAIVTTIQVRGIFSRNARRRREVVELLRGAKRARKEPR